MITARSGRRIIGMLGTVAAVVAGALSGVDLQDLVGAAKWVGDNLVLVALGCVLVAMLFGNLHFSILDSRGRTLSFVLGVGGRWRPSQSPPADAGAGDAGSGDVGSGDVGSGDAGLGIPSNSEGSALAAVADMESESSGTIHRLPVHDQSTREIDLYLIGMLETGRPLPAYWSKYVSDRFVDMVVRASEEDQHQMTLPW